MITLKWCNIPTALVVIFNFLLSFHIVLVFKKTFDTLKKSTILWFDELFSEHNQEWCWKPRDIHVIIICTDIWITIPLLPMKNYSLLRNHILSVFDSSAFWYGVFTLRQSLLLKSLFSFYPHVISRNFFKRKFQPFIKTLEFNKG